MNNNVETVKCWGEAEAPNRKPLLRGIHHLAINTDDLRTTLDFYVRVMGMPLVHGLETGTKKKHSNAGNPPFPGIPHYFVDMGGGYFGGNYFPGKPTIPQYAAVICETLRQGFDPAKTALVLEPGAGILATAMDYLATAVSLREVRGKRIVTLDGSLLHINPFMHPHPVPFTMIHPGEKIAPGERENWIVAGSTCMEMDRIDPRGMDRRPREGTRFLFHCCGAYMATHNSNFINAAPAIYALRGGEWVTLRDKDPQRMALW